MCGRFGKASIKLARLAAGLFALMAIGGCREGAVPCLVTRDTAVILIMGQSNAANFGSDKYASRRGALNFNAQDGACYPAQDPLKGSDGEGGSFAARLADKLIGSGAYANVIVAPIAIGGTDVNQWATRYIGRIGKVALPVTVGLWQQGESDAISGTTSEAYAEDLRQVVAAFRARWRTAPLLVAQATLCRLPGPDVPDVLGRRESIRSAQRSVVNAAEFVEPGPDFDTLDDVYRFDGCHFNARGLEAAAELWLRAIVNSPTSR